MTIELFQNYMKQYESNAKKICYRIFYPRISKDSGKIIMKKSSGNYDLFFNKKGILTHMLSLRGDYVYKIIFCYSKSGILVKAIEFKDSTQELVSITDFKYDKEGRIEEEHEYNPFDLCRETYHYYSDGKEMVHLIDNEHEAQLVTLKSFDVNNKIVEEKATRSEMDDDGEVIEVEDDEEENVILWQFYEYDDEGNRSKEILKDTNGAEEGITEYSYFNDGKVKSEISSSKNSCYTYEYEYLYNEKEHWKRMTSFKDKEVSSYYERGIEYF